MAERVRDHDWSSSPLGPIEAWPPILRTTLGLCLKSSVPTAIYWGPDLLLLYNDTWAPVPGERHPLALGRPAAEVWSDIWHIVGPQFGQVMATGEGFSTYGQMLPMRRNGVLAETYWNYSLTPILDESGRVAGLFNQGNETTDIVLAARAQAFLLDVGDRIRDALAPDRLDPTEILSATLQTTGAHLGAARVGYAEVEGGGCTIVEDWRRPPLTPLKGLNFPFADYGPWVAAEAFAGRIVAIADVRADARLPAEASAAFLSLGVIANLVVPIARDGRTFALLFVHDDKPRAWTQHETDALREAADRMWLGYEQARSAAGLRESRGRFAALFGQASVGLAELDLAGGFRRVNSAMARLLGRDADELLSMSDIDVTAPEDRPESRTRILEAAADGASFQIEKRYVRADGGHVWVASNVNRLVDDRGRPSGFLAVVSDISDRRDADRVRTLLLAELNHRVKNNLATVQALARQSRQSADGPDDFLASFDARLMALSRAHDLLMNETWASASLEQIGQAALAPYAIGPGTRVTVEGPPVRLAPTAAVTMSMAVHELASNAAKFGALSSDAGQVAMSWTIEAEERRLALSWRETGGPAVSPPARRGYGSRLIERGVVQELGGDARIDFSSSGVVCTIRVPLSKKVMAQ